MDFQHGFGRPADGDSFQIRDLEARVEILSGNKDETYVQMRDIIRGMCDVAVSLGLIDA